MIGLSVAVGRFVEALFWAILRVAGTVTAAVLAGALVLAVAIALIRRMWRKRKILPGTGRGTAGVAGGGGGPDPGGEPSAGPPPSRALRAPPPRPGEDLA